MLKKFTAVDFEMPDNYDRRICAVGITMVEDNVIIKQFYSLVNPNVPFTPFIMNLTGITPQMVEKSPDFREIWQEVREMFEDTVIVAHSAGNDLKVLSHCLKYYGIEWKDKLEYICTFEAGRETFPNRKSLGLASLCEELNINLEHHNALSDSEACAKLLIEYQKLGFDAEKNTSLYDMAKGRKIHNDNSKKDYSAIITNELLTMANEECKKRYESAYPDVAKESILGVSSPKIEKLQNKLLRNGKFQAFIEDLPHKYFEENLLHAMLISSAFRRNGKYKTSVNIQYIDYFLPYIDNKAVLDQIKPKLFSRREDIVKTNILCLLQSENKYSLMLAVNCLCEYCIDSQWIEETFLPISKIKIHDSEVEETLVTFFTKLMVDCPKKTLAFIGKNSLCPQLLEKIKAKVKTDDGISQKFKDKIELLS